MKFRNLLLLASLAILVFACSKDDEPKPEPNAAPKISDQSFVASEDVSDSKVIGTVTATDADEDALVFSISTNDNNLFEITEAGALSLASGKSLDFNTAKSHQITVSVSDGEDEATAKVTITVTNVNSSAQIEDQTFEVAEDVDGTTVIGSVQATDEDGDELAFAIVTNDNDLFKITATGDLSLADGRELDFETSETHTLMVGVSDGVDTAAAEITINVTNVNDNAPEMADQAFTVAEDVDDVTAIGTVVATDVDGDDLTFTIVTNDNDLFEITETGELSLAEGQELDFETSTSHSIVVSVTDGVGEAQAQVDINVENVIDTLAEDPESFVTTWQTQGDGETITIYTREELTYDYTIDWGDGTIETITTSDDAEHAYANAGTYTVAIKGQFPAIHMLEEGDYNYSLIGIDQWGGIQWESMENAFNRCYALTYVGTDSPDLSKITSTYGMFSKAELFNGNLSNWDVGSITNMAEMFSGARSFNGDIGNWDVSNVTSMAAMFEQASEFNGDIGNWNVSNVENMSSMFLYATFFNQNIGNWDVSNVTNMAVMFGEASEFNGDISNWNVGNVINMFSMFYNATSFNQDIGNWNVGNVTNMNSMFTAAIAFNQNLENWNVGNVTDMNSMFFVAEAFDQNLGNWDISSVTAMDGMLDNSGLSMENYEATLIGWAGLNGVPSNITLGATGLTLCGAEAATARAFLDDDKAWTIVGDNSDSCL